MDGVCQCTTGYKTAQEAVTSCILSTKPCGDADMASMSYPHHLPSLTIHHPSHNSPSPHVKITDLPTQQKSAQQVRLSAPALNSLCPRMVPLLPNPALLVQVLVPLVVPNPVLLLQALVSVLVPVPLLQLEVRNQRLQLRVLKMRLGLRGRLLLGLWDWLGLLLLLCFRWEKRGGGGGSCQRCRVWVKGLRGEKIWV